MQHLNNDAVRIIYTASEYRKDGPQCKSGYDIENCNKICKHKFKIIIQFS